MELAVWYFLALVIVFAGFYYKKRSFAKAFFLTSFTFTLITLVFAVFVYQDVNDLKKNLMTQPKLFVLSDGNGKPLAAFTASDLANDMPNYVNLSDLKEITTGLESDLYESEDSPYYKTFVINLGSLIKSLPPVVKYDKIEISKNEMSELLSSERPRFYLTKSVAPENFKELDLVSDELLTAFLDQLGSPVEFKGQVFALDFTTAIQNKGPLLIMELIRSGDMKIIPESVAFKFIKAIPSSVMNDIVSYVSRKNNNENT